MKNVRASWATNMAGLVSRAGISLLQVLLSFWSITAAKLMDDESMSSISSIPSIQPTLFDAACREPLASALFFVLTLTETRFDI